MMDKVWRSNHVDTGMTSEAIVDTPTTVDLLGFKRFVDPIAQIIASSTNENTPLTIGVYGEWGSGKTSFLQMIDEALRKEGIHPVWFNAWKYDKEDNLWSALLQTILDQARVSGRWYRRVWVKLRIWWDSIDIRAGLWEVSKKLSPVLFRSFLVLGSATLVLGWSSVEMEVFLNRVSSQWPPIVARVISQPHFIKAIVTLVGFIAAKPEGLLRLFDTKLGIDLSKLSRKPTYREHIAFLDKFIDEFQRTIRLSGGGKPLVVIIDDLDRCLPEKAMQVLEAIKLLMDVQGCVFLLAVDQTIIERAIAVKYKDILAIEEPSREPGENPRKLATFHTDYTEKIIQLPISLPRLAEADVAEFIRNLTTDKDILLCANIFGAGLPPNPRKIKRALRAFLFVRYVAAHDIRDNNISPSLLAKLIVIQTSFPLLFEAIAESPALLEELEKYYHGQVETQAGADSALRERAEEYAVQYPQVRHILLQRVDSNDTFIKAPIERYVTLVGAIAEVQHVIEKLTPALVKYLKYISTDTAFLQISGVTTSLSMRLNLEKIFIAPQFTTPQTSTDMKPEPIERSPLNLWQVDTKSIRLDEVIRNSRHFVILGGPGSGKTTLLKYLANIFARAMIAGDTHLIQSRLGLHDLFIPIMLRLSEFSQYATPSGNAFLAPGGFVEFLSWYLKQWDIDIPSDIFSRYLERGKCLLLFDGLDEVAPEHRYFVVESINALSARYPLNRYIVTSRTISYQNERIRPRGFDVYMLAPWSIDQIAAFIDAWLLNLENEAEHNTARIKDFAKRLKMAVFRTPVLMPLAANALLLTIIVLLYHYEGVIPDSRAALYNEAIQLLLMQWDRAKGLDRILGVDPTAPREAISRALASIALQIQQSGKADLDEATVLRVFAREIGESVEEVRPILRLVSERSGLFIEQRPGRYGFVQRSFQEYFAALALTTQPNSVAAVLDLWRRDGEAWREVILFEASILYYQGRYDDAVALIRALLNNKEPSSVLLASECLLESGLRRAPKDLVQQILDALERLEADEAMESSIRARAKELGRRLQP